MPQKRNVSRSDIECSGDTIPYNCSILSNSEYVHLIWIVTLPEHVPMTITFDGSSSLDVVYYLDMNITVTLTNYVAEEYIESIIALTVLSDVVVNGTVLECRSGDLDSRRAIVNVNMSGIINFFYFTALKHHVAMTSKISLIVSVPNIPTDLNVTGQYDTLDNTTITFSWVPPQGSGVETVVDKHLFFITPVPLSHSTLTVVFGDAINVTLEYNMLYNASILAVNCAGESSLVYLIDNKFSKCVK